MCGEKGVYALLYTGLWGSPPHMRGKVVYLHHGDGHKEDHPRVCGEKAAYLRAVWVPMGSPPRMRGKEVGDNPTSNAYRITPAYAGKSPRPLRPRCRYRDHPRVCGEKWLSVLQIRLLLGSPPRMRGKGLSPPVRAAV